MLILFALKIRGFHAHISLLLRTKVFADFCNGTLPRLSSAFQCHILVGMVTEVFHGYERNWFVSDVTTGVLLAYQDAMVTTDICL